MQRLIQQCDIDASCCEQEAGRLDVSHHADVNAMTREIVSSHAGQASVAQDEEDMLRICRHSVSSFS